METSKRTFFVNIIKDHTVVLNRPMLSKMIAAKDKGWIYIKGKYEKVFGKL